MDTKNRIGVRRSYPAQALSGMGVERAPAETPPVSALYPTRPLSGVRNYSTQPTLYALGALVSDMDTNNVRLAGRYLAPGGASILPPVSIISASNPPVTPVAVSAPAPSTQPTTQPTPWSQQNGGGPSSWQQNRASGGWGTSAVPGSTPQSGSGTPWYQQQQQEQEPGAPSYASPPAAGTTAQAGTPVPFNWPITQPYTDTNGNIWTYQNGQWAITSAVPSTAYQYGATPSTYPTYAGYPSGVALQTNGPAGQTAQAGTPVPVGWPTSESYTDSNGNIWTYTTTAGWQVTGTSASASESALLAEESAAAAATGTSTTSGGTTVTVTGDTTWSTITSWLQSSTIISGVPNFFLAAGAGVVGLLIFTRGKH